MRLASRLSLIVALAVSGCAHRGNVELLEAQLRRQEDQIRSLHAQVEQTSSELSAARRLNESLKKQLVQTASHDVTLDLAERHFQVTGLKINSLLTGGFDRDGRPGDDQITLVVAPIDKAGQPIQVPGVVECELHDPSRSPEQQRIGVWTFDAVATQAAWRKTLGSFGYRFELPWQMAPQSSDLELHVRFRTQYGDRFESSAKVTIHLPKSSLGADRSMP